MTVLVLDTETCHDGPLDQQLKRLGFSPIYVGDRQSAHAHCEESDVHVLLCDSTDLLPTRESLSAGTALIYMTQIPLSERVMSLCFEHGVNDCWQLPLSDNDMAFRLHRAIARSGRSALDNHAELLRLRNELEQDLRAGQYIQMSMLPPNDLTMGAYQLSRRVEPSLLLSGDFIDYFPIADDYFVCYLADVSGHGASSAFITVLLKNLSRQLCRDLQGPALTRPDQVLHWINAELIEQHIDKHVAMFFAIVDTRNHMMCYANAAHFPPALMAARDGCIRLEQKGKPLGLFENAVFESRQIAFPKHARLVVFSDGVLDLLAPTQLQDKEARLSEVVSQSEDIDELWTKLEESSLGHDDVSCLLVCHG